MRSLKIYNNLGNYKKVSDASLPKQQYIERPVFEYQGIYIVMKVQF